MPVAEPLDLWLRLTRRDLADSRALLALERLDNAGYLAQQSAEKLLKALLVEARIGTAENA